MAVILVGQIGQDATVAAAGPVLAGPVDDAEPTIREGIAHHGAFHDGQAPESFQRAWAVARSPHADVVPVASRAVAPAAPKTVPVVLMAGAGPGVRRLELAYIEDSHGKWIFSQATVLLVPSAPDDVSGLHGNLASALRKKLGKPKFTKKGDAPLPRIGWKLSGHVELWLGEETSTLPGGTGPECHIRIDVAAPGGDAG